MNVTVWPSPRALGATHRATPACPNRNQSADSALLASVFNSPPKRMKAMIALIAYEAFYNPSRLLSHLGGVSPKTSRLPVQGADVSMKCWGVQTAPNCVAIACTLIENNVCIVVVRIGLNFDFCRLSLQPDGGR